MARTTRHRTTRLEYVSISWDGGRARRAVALSCVTGYGDHCGVYVNAHMLRAGAILRLAGDFPPRAVEANSPRIVGWRLYEAWTAHHSVASQGHARRLGDQQRTRSTDPQRMA